LSLQITINMIVGAKLIFFWKNGVGIEPTTLDLNSQSGPYDFSAKAACIENFSKHEQYSSWLSLVKF